MLDVALCKSQIKSEYFRWGLGEIAIAFRCLSVCGIYSSAHALVTNMYNINVA